MKLRSIIFFFFPLIILFLFLSCSPAKGHNIDEAYPSLTNINTQTIEKEIIIPTNKTIKALTLYSLNDTIETIAVYTDDSNLLKALLFKYNGTSYPQRLTVSINSTDFEIDAEPDENGYVYAYFDVDLVCDNTIALQYKASTDYTDIINITPTKIVTTTDDWTTSTNGNSLYLYNGNSTNITVPNFYNDKIISQVGGYIAEDENYYNIVNDSTSIAISDITISKGIAEIGNYAFLGLSSLTSVQMSDTIQLIGGAAFAETALGGDITIPEGTKEIYAYAFTETNITSVTFNDNLERLCTCAFSNCAMLSSEIKFPPSLYYLGSGVFANCTSLTGGITIPAKVGTVPDSLFYNCPSMNGDIVIEEGITEIGDFAFSAYNKVSQLKSVAFPSTLKSIGQFAFQFCGNIKSLDLPEGLETISDGAFNHMTAVENEVITIPSTVKTIGGDYNTEENTNYGCHVFYDLGKNETFKAFEVAEGNQYFTAVDGVLYSKDMTRMVAYPRGREGETFELPEGITQLDEMAFSRACNLKTLILPDSYVISESVPANILNQDGNSLAVALYVYTTVNNVSVKDTNPHYISQNGILYSKDMTALWYIPNKYNGEIAIPEGVTDIKQGAVFIANKANTNWTAISIPATIENINMNTAQYLSDYFSGYITIGENSKYSIDKDTNKILLKGDVNSDFTVDKKDISLLLKYIANISFKDSFNKNAAYVNDDDKIDLLDVIAISF